MRQPRVISLVEAEANVVVGYVVAVLVQTVLFPMLGLQASLGQNLPSGSSSLACRSYNATPFGCPKRLGSGAADGCTGVRFLEFCHGQCDRCGA